MTAVATFRAALRGVRAAFVFLTRIPVGGHPYAPADWIWAPASFPLVGLVLGALLAALDRLLWPLGPLAGATFVVTASLLLTGALHEDGLADTSDALGGSIDRDTMFRILKDSRIGTFGACALLVSIVGRIALLARMGHGALGALMLVGCAARVGPVWQMVTLPYVSPAGKSRDLAGTGILQGAVATAWLALASAFAVGTGTTTRARLVSLAIVVAAVTALTSWRFVRRAGGITGDFLGATEQICELAGYAVLAWDRG
jgi:adenosylcobinamide-GDP ribazoletransferase